MTRTIAMIRESGNQYEIVQAADGRRFFAIVNGKLLMATVPVADEPLDVELFENVADAIAAARARGQS